MLSWRKSLLVAAVACTSALRVGVSPRVAPAVGHAEPATRRDALFGGLAARLGELGGAVQSASKGLLNDLSSTMRANTEPTNDLEGGGGGGAHGPPHAGGGGAFLPPGGAMPPQAMMPPGEQPPPWGAAQQQQPPPQAQHIARAVKSLSS